MSGLVLFHEAMEKFAPDKGLEEQLQRFERAAAKGHEESIWIRSVVKDVEMEEDALIEAFAQTEELLGRYFAGWLSDGRERFEFWKKSAEGGCSWGQVAYGWCFKYGEQVVEQNDEVYVEWLEKAANQNNPQAMNWLGDWFCSEEQGNDEQKAVSYYRAGAELGWNDSMELLAEMLREGAGCAKDLKQAVIWGAKGDSYVFWDLLAHAKGALESRATENLDCQSLCYSLGWGLYWYQYGSEDWDGEDDEVQVFGNDCLDYYCSCVEMQQESIFTFLLCWNRTTGVKGPGEMIAQLVWEGREDNLVKAFEESDGEESETKRIKKGRN
jgi:hypothetical protein